MEKIKKKIVSFCSCFSLSYQTRSTISNTVKNNTNIKEDAGQSGLTSKSLCAICLDPLTISTSASDAVPSTFTGECTHTFHFTCIASNVRHGSITCPICRAHWSHLPRYHLITTAAATDPILQIIEDSIATSRVNRRSTLRSRSYSDDDPLEPVPPHSPSTPRLHLSLVHSVAPYRLYLSVKLSLQTPVDLVLVVSPDGPHLRLLKQAVSLVISALSSFDRLSIVTYSSSSATRAFPLRRMSPHGRRAALRLVDRLLYVGSSTNATHGVQKALKILDDRTHRNPSCCILHLTDIPSRQTETTGMVTIHRFHVGFGVSNGYVMHEFREFLGRVMGGVVREGRIRVGCEGEWVRLGEVRGGEERRVLVDVKENCEFVCVGYSYVEGEGDDEQLVTGETVVGFEEKGEFCSDGEREVSCVEGRRDYLDPFMARRWAKHLHRA